MEHTKEPWTVEEEDGETFINSTEMGIATVDCPIDRRAPNANRIASCVNALAGVKNPADAKEAMYSGLLLTLEANRMRDCWAEGDAARKTELWRNLHAAAERAWNAQSALANGHPLTAYLKPVAVFEPGIVKPDGSLHSLGWYLNWDRGDKKACLDGDFTPAELRLIADHMDAHPKQTADTPRE